MKKIGALFCVLALYAPKSLWASGEVIDLPVHPLWMTPFLFLVSAIAIAPFLHKEGWERYYPALSLGLGFVVALYYLLGRRQPERVWHTVSEYIGFISLIGSLYVVTGGVWIHIEKKATPLLNTALLFGGAVLSNMVGTTGASVLLIRPYLRMNRGRVKSFHIVFFIFIVGNIGGMLTPVGDPPLFLGYLKGVPFFWSLRSLWPFWILSLAFLLLLFYVNDRRLGTFDAAAKSERKEKIWVEGGFNFIFLAVILAALFQPFPLREITLAVSAIASYRLSKKEILHKNGFDFIPIREVAILFFGIFMTMTPTLQWLEINAGELRLSTASQFFWSTGLLSAVLDNAPTYLTFLGTAAGLHHLSLDSAGDMALFLSRHAIYLKAVSVGAVLFGAMTYIGNAPNFLVKTITEREGIKIPGFFGYMIYSFLILTPLYILIGLFFFR